MISTREMLGPMRILVVEDDLVIQKLATYLLRRQGHAVALVQSGEEAVALAHRDPFDVIFMDIQLPGIDGLEATQQLRQRLAPDLQPWIVAFTGEAEIGETLRFVSAGMDDLLCKPFTAEALTRVLERAVYRRLLS